MKYKLICFDLDGTLIDNDNHIWETIHDRLGIDKELRERNKRAFSEGTMTYQEWVEDDVGMWVQKGVTKDYLLEILNDIQMMEGTLETLQKLKNKGMIIALISGGFNFVVEKIFKQHQMLFDYMFINKLVFGEGSKIIGVKATPYDGKYKAEGLKYIAEREKIPIEKCVFVGDHDNDLEIAKLAGLSIAFNPKSSNLIEVCDVLIQNNDLRDILKYLE